MNEELRDMLDNMDELMDELRSRVSTSDQVMFALYEEAEDDPASTEIPGLLIDAGKEIAALGLSVMAAQALLGDIAKELLA